MRNFIQYLIWCLAFFSVILLVSNTLANETKESEASNVQADFVDPIVVQKNNLAALCVESFVRKTKSLKEKQNICGCIAQKHSDKLDQEEWDYIVKAYSGELTDEAIKNASPVRSELLHYDYKISAECIGAVKGKSK